MAISDTDEASTGSEWLVEARCRPDDSFVGEDLRCIEWRGRRVARMSLRGARLDGADLSGTAFDLVDLCGASLDGADMANARFRFVDVTGASLRDAVATGSHWRNCDLSSSDLDGADLSGSSFHSCTLQRTRLDRAALTGAQMAACACDDASFTGGDLAGLESVGSTYRRADFRDARSFFLAREIVGELLRREIGHNFEVARSVGAVLVGKEWCWDHWRDFLESHPDQRRLAQRVFQTYPDSGALSALQDTTHQRG